MNLEGRSDPARTEKLRRKKQYKRDQRPENPKRLYWKERYDQIIQWVYDYKLLTTSQLQLLLGRGRGTVQDIVMRLFHHGYLRPLFLDEVVGRGKFPTLYTLDEKAIEKLRRKGIEEFKGFPTGKLSNDFLQHTIGINTFRICLTLACEALGWRVSTWVSEKEIKADYDYVTIRDLSGKNIKVPVVPDSFGIIDIPNEGISPFFLELDRGKMSVPRFVRKVSGYVVYLKAGLYEKRFDAKNFRVFTVIDTDTPGFLRLENLKVGTEKIDYIDERFWFTRLADITPQNVLQHPIWQVAGSEDLYPLFE